MFLSWELEADTVSIEAEKTLAQKLLLFVISLGPYKDEELQIRRKQRMKQLLGRIHLTAQEGILCLS
jgi:hypothetical protein